MRTFLSPEAKKEILRTFGQELGAATAGLKKSGVADRAVRYELAFAELRERGLLSLALQTKPKRMFVGDGSFFEFNPKTREICWTRDYDLRRNPSKWDPENWRIHVYATDAIWDNGELSHHVTPGGDFISYSTSFTPYFGPGYSGPPLF